MASPDELWQSPRKEGGCQRVLRNLIFGDKITNNLLILPSLAVDLPLPFTQSLKWSQKQTHTHTYKLSHQRSAVSEVPWQSITAVETAQVLCMRKMLAKTSMRIWTLHTRSAIARGAVQDSPFYPAHPAGHLLQPRPSTKCHYTVLWGTKIQARQPVLYFIFVFREQCSHLSSFRIFVTTWHTAVLR